MAVETDIVAGCFNSSMRRNNRHPFVIMTQVVSTKRITFFTDKSIAVMRQDVSFNIIHVEIDILSHSRYKVSEFGEQSP